MAGLDRHYCIHRRTHPLPTGSRAGRTTLSRTAERNRWPFAGDVQAIRVGAKSADLITPSAIQPEANHSPLHRRQSHQGSAPSQIQGDGATAQPDVSVDIKRSAPGPD